MSTKQEQLREEYMNWTCIEKEYESVESEQADWWLSHRTEELTGIVEWCEGMKEEVNYKDDDNIVLALKLKHNQVLEGIQVYIKSLIGGKE